MLGGEIVKSFGASSVCSDKEYESLVGRDGRNAKSMCLKRKDGVAGHEYMLSWLPRNWWLGDTKAGHAQKERLQQTGIRLGGAGRTRLLWVSLAKDDVGVKH